jgi:small nuclear ribonucleoprotein (snRNP)-like protein
MDYTKPFTHLHGAKGKNIEVVLKNNRVYQGTLESFDLHLNIVLSNVTETFENSTENYEKILIRGDMIVIVKNI